MDHHEPARNLKTLAQVKGHRQSQASNLGPLEKEVMDLVWTGGPGNVREVLSRMGRKVAYTTVMTTLKRLSEKGFLHRYMADRAFIYSARLTKEDWSRRLVSDLVEDLLARPPESRGLVLYCLIDAVGKYDETLLDELKAKIQLKQEELGERKLIDNDTEKSQVRSA